jgi:hypothetical protein
MPTPYADSSRLCSVPITELRDQKANRSSGSRLSGLVRVSLVKPKQKVVMSFPCCKVAKAASLALSSQTIQLASYSV